MYSGSGSFPAEEMKYLKLLSNQYKNINSAATEIINLKAILNLPKGTEHFVSDIHGEADSFSHVLRNASGVIKNQISAIFGESLRSSEKKSLATLIYYPEQKLEKMAEAEEEMAEWYKILNDKISMNLNEKDGYITITVYMPEPLAAAQLAFKVQMLLQQYVTDFKIEKVKANLDFVEGRYQEAKHQYEVKQEELALFEDANRNPSTSVARAAQARLTNEYTLLFGVYNELAKQREQAYIKVKETTPVFTVVEPVTIPAERSKPKRGLICIAFTFLGGFIGIGLVLILPFLAQVSGCKRLKGWLPEEKE